MEGIGLSKKCSTEEKWRFIYLLIHGVEVLLVFVLAVQDFSNLPWFYNGPAAYDVKRRIH